MQQRSDWESCVVSVIKVARNRREIHFGGTGSLENILFSVKWTRLMSKQKQTVFVDVGRYRGGGEPYRRAPNDKRHIDRTRLSYAVLFVRTCCMQNQQWAEIHLEPVYHYQKWITFCLFVQHSNIKIDAKGQGGDLFRHDKIWVSCPWHSDF